MGNCIKVKPAYKHITGSQDGPSQESRQMIAANFEEEVNCHPQIYHYQKVMLRKEPGSRHHMKLELTEEIIRVNRARLAEIGADREAINSEIRNLLKYRKKLIATIIAEMSRSESPCTSNCSCECS